jgi:hypothetical protein
LIFNFSINFLLILCVFFLRYFLNNFFDFTNWIFKH